MIGLRLMAMCPRSAATACALALIVGLTACGEIRMVAGRPFDTSVLESSLTVGQSDREDVLAALRQPDGVGRYYSPLEQRPLVMWSYTYETGSFPSYTNRKLLFVFFRDGKFDGYIWFQDRLAAK